MLNQILDLFPAHTHPLTLASDPDGLLSNESARVELAARGFRILQEADPVVLRHQVEQARPFTTEQPVLVITVGQLEDLPFDLWQPAHRITLSLHQYFPNLAYPVLRTLAPSHLEKLLDLQPPSERLSRRGTIDYLLLQVFELRAELIDQPHHLVAWLIHLHEHLFPLPQPLQDRFLELTQAGVQYAGWNLKELVESRAALADFLQREWSGYVLQPARLAGGEKRAVSEGQFFGDENMQDLLPQLLRHGLLNPVKVEHPAQVPSWAQMGIEPAGAGPEHTEERIRQILAELSAQFSAFHGPSRWEEWQNAAAAWAELNRLLLAPDRPINEELAGQVKALAASLDRCFQEWLPAHYGALATQRLPVPRQVHHVPHYLSYLKNQGRIQRAALIILDGMSLCDWLVIRRAWGERHPDWAFEETQLLAQVPTITAISRRALVSGLPATGFAADPDHLPSEKSLWEGFWLRAGLPAESCYYSTLSLDRLDAPAEIDRPRLAALCLVDDTTDQLVHHAVFGAASQRQALQLWLTPGHGQNSEPLEALLDRLIGRGFTVFLSSDHGHVQAQGMGSPSEGIMATTRGKRARLYPDPQAAVRTQEQYPDTILWQADGLLPAGLAVLMPSGRTAFTTPGEIVETHGGISLDEMVVPLIQITGDLQLLASS